MKIPGRCHIDSEGILAGPITVHRNTPWPCRNGYASGFSHQPRGLVIHTEDGFEQGTIAWFNNPKAKASAWFAVGLNGDVWQFAPVGSGWASWAQEDGNVDWYSVEDADNTDPAKPFTPAQIAALAQIFEALSAHDGFPLQITDHVDGHGLIYHGAGGVAWGDHLECPGNVRKHQRPEILGLALAIRSAAKAA